MKDLTNTLPINQEITKLSTDALLELFVLDATMLGADDVLRFHPGTDVKQSPIVFKGKTYVPFPVEAKGFVHTAKGAPARPSISFANVSGMFKDLCLNYDDLLGAKVIRKRVYARHIDANWVPRYEGDIQPELPEDIYFIDRKTNQNKLVVEFELGTLPDVEGVALPRRIVTGDNCMFGYRRECPFDQDVVVTDKKGAEIAGAIKFRGYWSTNVAYSAGESVREGSLIYKATANTNTGESPSTTPGKWLFVQKFMGEYNKDLAYSAKDVVYRLVHRDIKIYFYAKTAVPAGVTPPNDKYWVADDCTKKVTTGCKAHFDPLGQNKSLPYGGFVGTIKLPSMV